MAKTYTCKHDPNVGLEIKIKRINLMDIQKPSTDFPLPDPPTYFAKTVTGSYEELPIQDMETAEAVEGGVERYNFYLQKMQSAQLKQSSATLRTMYLNGCDFEIPQWDWQVIDEFKGIDVPKHPLLKKVFYLEHHLAAEDTVDLVTAIMEETGVGEDAIKKAEQTFRSAILPGESVIEPGPDAQTNTIHPVEAQ
jgi:hypothetical protein